jgi:hypothetical protein
MVLGHFGEGVARPCSGREGAAPAQCKAQRDPPHHHHHQDWWWEGSFWGVSRAPWSKVLACRKCPSPACEVRTVHSTRSATLRAPPARRISGASTLLPTSGVSTLRFPPFFVVAHAHAGLCAPPAGGPASPHRPKGQIPRTHKGYAMYLPSRAGCA